MNSPSAGHDRPVPERRREPARNVDPSPPIRVLVELRPANPAFGLALDEAILTKSADRFTLRLWRNRLSVIVGRSQRIEDEVDVDRCHDRHIPVYRRCSGGGTVLHYPGNLNISWIVREAWNSRTVDEVDAACGNAIARAVRGLGVECRHALRAVLTDDGSRKLSGSAQAVRGGGRLYHATLLLSPPPVAMADLLRAMQPGYAPLGLPSRPRAVASINELLHAQRSVAADLRAGVDTEPGLTALVNELMRSFADLTTLGSGIEFGVNRDPVRKLDAACRLGTITAEECSWATHLKQIKYSTSAWTHRH